MRPAAESVERLIRQLVELAGLGVSPDLLIESYGVELLEPIPKSGELVGRQLGDGFLKVFDGHEHNIAEELGPVEAETTSE